jgi:glycine betaine transporter
MGSVTVALACKTGMAETLSPPQTRQGAPEVAQQQASEAPPTGRLGSVFYVSVGLVAAFVLWGVISTDSVSTASNSALNWVTETLGWSYLVISLALLAFLIFLACSRYGRIRLGSDDSRPEFKTRSWIAMILSAVMGIGLISYGVAEPVSHFAAPPHGITEAETPRAAVVAMQYSFFDWGLHAWAVFAVFGLAIGYSTHRKGRRGLVSPMFAPLLGDRVDGPIGKAIDVLAIVATLFGTTTSLGLGALQINNGLNALYDVPTSTTVQVGIIAIVTVLFTVSAVTGVSKGIRFLSESAMGLAILLFVFMVVAGPTVYLINLFTQSLGLYINDFLSMSLRTPADGDLVFMQFWTYFMLSWWISWGAFVGVFLARISRGRTIREFIVGVLVVPSMVFFAWFTVFGGTGMHLDLVEGGNIAEVTSNDVNAAFFAVLDAFPFATVTSLLAIVLVVLFFVSGADANTYVLSMLSSDGAMRPRTPVLVLWGVLTGAVAVVLLIAGGLSALQTAVIVSSAPFLVVIAGLGVSFWRELRTDVGPPRVPVDQRHGMEDLVPEKITVLSHPTDEKSMAAAKR